MVAEGPRLLDFFVSYTSADEAWARWITSELTAAGYNVFAQYKDIVAGHDFQLTPALASQLGLRGTRPIEWRYSR